MGKKTKNRMRCDNKIHDVVFEKIGISLFENCNTYFFDKHYVHEDLILFIPQQSASFHKILLHKFKK